jgi:hypothetical protein
MAGVDPDGLGGILDPDGWPLTGEGIGALHIVIDDIGLADTCIPDKHDFIQRVLLL